MLSCCLGYSRSYNHLKLFSPNHHYHIREHFNRNLKYPLWRSKCYAFLPIAIICNGKSAPAGISTSPFIVQTNEHSLHRVVVAWAARKLQRNGLRSYLQMDTQTDRNIWNVQLISVGGITAAITQNDNWMDKTLIKWDNPPSGKTAFVAGSLERVWSENTESCNPPNSILCFDCSFGMAHCL